MNLTSLRTLVLGAIVVALVVAACGGGGNESSTEPTAPSATQPPQQTQAAEPTQAAKPTLALEPTAPSAETQPQATEPPAEPTPTPESGIPYNVPVMEGAADLDIQDTGTVTYLMKDTMIEDVVEFYKTVMPEQGWELVSASEIGLMATLVFQTAEARVSISLQANNIAKTVTVRMFIIKK
jgi:hypothetical protein